MPSRPSLRTTISLSLLGFGALIIALNLLVMDRLHGGLERAWTGGQEVWEDAYRKAVEFSLLEAAVVVLGSLSLWWGWDRCITRRAEQVMNSAERLDGGGQPDAPLTGQDEISRISHALHAAHVRLNAQAAELRAREERYRLMVETMPAMVFTCRNGTIEYANPSAISLLGNGRTENVVGRSPVELVAPESHDDVRANLERLGRGPGIIRDVKRRLIGADGQVVHAELTITGFQDERGRALQVIANDVTARLAAEAQREELTRELAEKNQELEHLLYVASHDLRSPLINIQGFARLLEREWNSLSERPASSANPAAPAHAATAAAANRAFAAPRSNVPRALDYISVGVRRIDLLLEGLLRVSRLGRAAVDIRPLDPAPVLAEVLEPLRFQIEEAEAIVETEPLPPCLADRLMLSQALANLLDNALKYRNPAGPCHIRIAGRTVQNRVHYAVEDNGPGIPEADQPHIFEIFRRLSPESAPGQGLGLSLVQRCLARMDGRITLHSREGAGSVFTIDLPAAATA